MAGWSPPSVSRQVATVIALLYAAFLVYMLVVVQQLLLALFVGVALGTVYFAYRLLLAFEAIADAQQRLAAAREN
jgi:preprotein translocase subunit SecF